MAQDDDIYYGAQCKECKLPYVMFRAYPRVMIATHTDISFAWTCANPTCKKAQTITPEKLVSLRVTPARSRGT
jgi:hypothetical protein